MTPTQFFALYPSACRPGRDYANQFKTMSEVWDNCNKVNWLLWILGNHAPLQKDQSVRLAIAFAETCLDKIPEGENRPALAIQAAKTWLENPCDETAAAAAYAASAASAAYAASSASSAYSASVTYAAYSASAASAASAAYSASASYVTYSSDAAANARSASDADPDASNCKIIRSLIPNPFQP